jgi:hypothetical protein
MSLSDLVNTITLVTLIAGMVFALIQLRQYREARQREAALEFLRSFQSLQMTTALRLVFDLPSGLSGEEIERALADHMDLIYSLVTTWESIAILVFRNEVELELVDDFFSGPLLVSWEKLEPLVHRMRATTGRETISEWFQWLVERMMEREAAVAPVRLAATAPDRTQVRPLPPVRLKASVLQPVSIHARGQSCRSEGDTACSS